MATLKYSRQRESIKENLMHRCDHPTADMIYSDIRKIYPNISLGTVYRNLALLSDLGEIRKVTVDGGADRFDGNTSPNIHFTCRHCGAVLDLDMEDISRIKEFAGQNFHGIIESYSVNFYGLCENCTEKS